MGLMDKVKKLLFDEDIVEVPVKSDELPKRETKEIEEFPSRGSFINHHEVEENPIKEVILPKEEKEEIIEKEDTKKFNFVDDDDFDFMPKKKEENEYQETKYSRFNDFDNLRVQEKNNVNSNGGLQNNRDYKKLIEENKPKEKKPFTVTPPISPVYGYIDLDNKKNNQTVEVTTVNRQEIKRNFGPVSYNDQPITITREEKVEVKVVEPESVLNDEIEEIKTSGIENEYLGNNSIEESFETTSELETIDDEDKMYSNIDYTPQTIEESEEEREENEKLEDTIETDLFNLIDSMYKNDEDENGEDE